MCSILNLVPKLTHSLYNLFFRFERQMLFLHERIRFCDCCAFFEYRMIFGIEEGGCQFAEIYCCQCEGANVVFHDKLPEKRQVEMLKFK